MAKRSNKLTGNATKPITDFFKPKSLSQSSSLATVASNSDAPSSSEPTVSSIASSQIFLSQFSSSTHPPRVIHIQEKLQSRVLEDTTSLRKVSWSPTKPMVQTVSSTSSLKRSRSPDTQSPGLNPLPLRRIQKPLPGTCSSPARRNAKFDTDSNRERDSVVYVKRMVRSA